jgi:hypothetical protein
MTNYQIRTKADSLIKKAAKEHKKKGKHNWEKLGESFETLRRTAIDEVGIDDYTYHCNRLDEIVTIIDGKYDKYFKVGSMYDHIHGNKNFKKLLN